MASTLLPFPDLAQVFTFRVFKVEREKMRFGILILILVVYSANGKATGLPSGDPGSPCFTLKDCWQVGFELKSSSEVLITEENGDKRVFVTHYLQRNRIVVQCTHPWYPDGKPKVITSDDHEWCVLTDMR